MRRALMGMPTPKGMWLSQPRDMAPSHAPL